MQQRQALRQLGLGLQQFPPFGISPTYSVHLIVSNSQQYEAYNSMTSEPVPSISVPSSAPPAPPAPPAAAAPEAPPHQQPEEPKEQSKEARHDNVMSEQPVVSVPPPEMPQDLPVVSKEERVEYRDENGRVLNDDEVSALAGKVSFKTRYETRTRIVDAQGNEIYEGLVDARGDAEEPVDDPANADEPGVAGTIAEGSNPETQQEADAPEASEVPPTVEVVEDQQKEKSIEEHHEEAQPASEGQSATQQE
jgi:dolichyl-phosphate-mannose-protein mannosyltransferase